MNAQPPSTPTSRKRPRQPSNAANQRGRYKRVCDVILTANSCFSHPSGNLFEGMVVTVDPAIVAGSKQLGVWVDVLARDGAKIVTPDSVKYCTHIITKRAPAKVRKEFDLDAATTHIVAPNWISDSIKLGKLAPYPEQVAAHDCGEEAFNKPTEDDALSENPFPQSDSSAALGPSSGSNWDSQSSSMDLATAATMTSVDSMSSISRRTPSSRSQVFLDQHPAILPATESTRPLPGPVKNQASYTCMHPFPIDGGRKSYNAVIIKNLELLLNYYEATFDTWRIKSYRTAISAIKRHESPIHSLEDALAIHGVGESIAEKVEETVKTGSLAKSRNLPEKYGRMSMFQKVWGVGPKVAHQWSARGYKSLDEVKAKEKLTHSQSVGIRLYYDFLQRIPRHEAQEISDRVREGVAKAVGEGWSCITMGSFRRGAETCGDVDVIVSHPDMEALVWDHVLPSLISHLSSTGFLTDHLVSPKSTDKYMGVARLSPSHLHRRLDVLVIPWNSLGGAVLYFTGNDIFNRSMRLLASKKGLHLNGSGLFFETPEGDVGELIWSKTEEGIFKALGVPWRSPQERNP